MHEERQHIPVEDREHNKRRRYCLVQPWPLWSKGNETRRRDCQEQRLQCNASRFLELVTAGASLLLSASRSRVSGFRALPTSVPETTLRTRWTMLSLLTM
jgi:hypothetical protein